jgi:hypothetical protein
MMFSYIVLTRLIVGNVRLSPFLILVTFRKTVSKLTILFGFSIHILNTHFMFVLLKDEKTIPPCYILFLYCK